MVRHGRNFSNGKEQQQNNREESDAADKVEQRTSDFEILRKNQPVHKLMLDLFQVHDRMLPLVNVLNDEHVDQIAELCHSSKCVER